MFGPMTHKYEWLEIIEFVRFLSAIIFAIRLDMADCESIIIVNI